MKGSDQMTRFSFVLLFPICFGMFIGLIFAQEDAVNGGTVRGTITDTTEARNPIEGADVRIIDPRGTEYNTKTDANGEYKRSGIPAGRYLINIFKKGYGNRLGKPVTIVDGGDHFVPLRMAKKGNVEDRWSAGLLRHISESMGERYNLDKPVVEALRQSIFEALNTVLEQMNRDVPEFARTGQDGSVGLLEGLFSHPDCRAAFTKHLTEAQLQDYIDFIKILRQRDRQAVARHITARLDQELSLTVDQRKSVEQLIFDTVENEYFPIAISILETNSLLRLINLVRHELKIPLDGTLSQTQSKVWKKLVTSHIEASFKAVAAFEKRDEIDGPKAQLWSESPESQEQTRQLIAAKLTAHSELLGALGEDASRRLTVAIKGTVQQYFEARDKEAETMFHKVKAVLMGLVESGEMKREDAAEELNDMRRDLGNENGAIRRQLPNADITRHPLYQQTIKDVLSEEAFAQYTARQTERENWHQQALRGVAVASLGTQLILEDTQRKQLETTAAELTVGPLKTDAARDMFYQLLQRTNHEMLSTWQQETLTFMHTGFEREFGDRIKER